MPIIKSDYIRDKLSYIESKIKNDTKQELYNINKTAEDIFMHILNDVYGWQLVNANNIKTNFPAIDLIDTTNKIVIQVTSDTSSDKVKKDTIEKFKKLIKEDEYKAYHDYQIKMFYIKQKPNFKLKTLEILKKAQVEKSDLLGIEDINKQVSANPNIAQKVFKTLCEILHDKICDSDTPPQLTTKLGKSTIIGREKELEEIEYHLNSSKALLVHGIGGMGKSTIASYYLHQHKNKFDYYGFFEGLDDFVNKLEIALNLKIEKRQERLTIVLHELTKLNGNKLLVIDDIQDIEKNKKTIQKILDLKEHNGFKILLTSREEIEGIDKYLLNTLSIDDAKELFNSIYKVEDELLLEEILRYLDCHAFFVEKVAQTLENKKGLLKLKDIKDKFDNKDFPNIRVRKRENFNKLLQELFTLDKLEEDEVLLLKQLSILPSIDIEFNLLFKIFQVDDVIEFQENLEYLTEKGWLIYSDKSYKLHQIIKEFILANYTPYFEEVKNIIDYCLSYEIKIKEWITIFLESVASSCKKCQMKNKKVGYLYYLLGVNYYDYLANRKKSKTYLKYAKELYREVGEKVIPDIYHRLGDIDNNLDYLNKALSLYEEENNEKQKAICLNSIGTIYWNKGELDEALSYFKEELEILKKDDFVHLAINYNQQSLVYKDKENIKKALEYQIEAINLIEKAIKIEDNGFNKREQAQFINNLGELYMDETEELYLALESIRTALNIRKKILYEGHERFGESYDNLAIIEQKRGNINEAYKHQLKAIEIWEKSPPERDIYLKEARERLKNMKEKNEYQ